MKAIRNTIIASFACYSQALLGAEGGYSNYIPGFYGDMALAVAPEDGFAFKNDVYFYTADTQVTLLSGNLVVDLDIELLYDYASFFYKPGVTFLGAEYAMSATLPLGGLDLSATLIQDKTTTSGSFDRYSIGDLTIAPIILYWNNDNFHYSLTEYIVVPTADYDTNRAANTGLNYWTFETDFTLTYFNSDTGQDYSAVIGYNYNTENEDTDYQTGQEVHIDIVLNQFFSETFAIGLQAFHLEQITKDKGAGANLGSFKASATGLGPALSWIPQVYGGEAAFSAKWIKEIDATNRLEGDHFYISAIVSF